MLILKSNMREEFDAVNFFYQRTSGIDEFLNMFLVVSNIKFTSYFKQRKLRFSDLGQYFQYHSKNNNTGHSIELYNSEIVLTTSKDFMSNLVIPRKYHDLVQNLVIGSIVNSASIFDKKFNTMDIEKSISVGDSNDTIILRFNDHVDI